MIIEELTGRGMDEANMHQVLVSLLGMVKKDFVVKALKEREKQLEQKITENPAFCMSNRMYKVNWAIEDQQACYELDSYIYEYNALRSAMCKI